MLKIYSEMLDMSINHFSEIFSIHFVQNELNINWVTRYCIEIIIYFIVEISKWIVFLILFEDDANIID